MEAEYSNLTSQRELLSESKHCTVLFALRVQNDMGALYIWYDGLWAKISNDIIGRATGTISVTTDFELSLMRASGKRAVRNRDEK